MPETTLSEATYTGTDDYERTQFKTTFPKAIAEALGASGGDKLVWEIHSKNKVTVEVKDGSE